ncbi:MAG: DUF1549 domain-containing protein, partial [Planctomycetota bacterium]
DRESAIERLLSSPDFASYWSQLWATILVGRGDEPQSDRERLRLWMEQRLRENTPFDQVAFDLISADGVTTLHGPVNFLVANREDPVTQVSRVFLGVQLDCARCHDHPFDRWTQNDYEKMRRFFETMRVQEVSGGTELSDSPGDRRAGEDDLPQFLTGARPRTSVWRRDLAIMTVRVKPFARAIGNRAWQLLIGRGIVDPVDGLSESEPPSVGELHEFLANRLQQSGFDIQDLIRLICQSHAYARTDHPADTEATLVDRSRDYAAFAARRPRPMLPEQWVLSHETVVRKSLSPIEGGLLENKTGQADPVTINSNAIHLLGTSAVSIGGTDPLSFQRTSQGLLHEISIPSNANARSLEELFLATLQRQPSPNEERLFADASQRDVLYALLHCNEFVFNH